MGFYDRSCSLTTIPQMHINFSVLQLKSISFFPLIAIYFDILKVSIKISATTSLWKNPIFMWLRTERILTHTHKIYHSNYLLVQFYVHQMAKVALWSFMDHSVWKITKQYSLSSLSQNIHTSFVKYSEIIKYAENQFIYPMIFHEQGNKRDRGWAFSLQCFWRTPCCLLCLTNCTVKTKKRWGKFKFRMHTSTCNESSGEVLKIISIR